jgi:hypothetical protein
VFLPAKVVVERKLRTDAEGKTSVEETWQLRADDGHSMNIHVNYVRGAVARAKVEAKVYSGAKPEFFRIYRVEQASDVARSTATGVDRVSSVSVKMSGQKLAPLFDGTDQRHFHSLVFAPGVPAGAIRAANSPLTYDPGCFRRCGARLPTLPG